MTKTFLIFILFFTSQIFYSQPISQEFKEILYLQDQRSLGEDNKLLSYLNNSNSDVVTQALYTLANIGDSATVNFIGEKLLNSTDKEVQKMAAFALGQIPSDASEKFLLDALSMKEDHDVLNAILNSLGKIGKGNALEIVSGYNNLNVRGSVAMSIARFALRGIISPSAVSKLKSLLASDSDLVTKRNAAYAFWRIGDKKLIENASSEIFYLLNEDDDIIKMWAVNAAGKLQNSDAMNFILTNFPAQNDWRVKVNMLNALMNFRDSSFAEDHSQILSMLSSAYNDDNPNVRISALGMTGRYFAGLKLNEDIKNEIQNNLSDYFKAESAIDWQEKGEAINSYAFIFKNEAKDILLMKYSETGNYDLKPYIIRALVNIDDPILYKELRDSISADVQRYNTLHPNTTGEMLGSKDLAKIYRAFVDYLNQTGANVDAAGRNTYRLIFYEFLSSGDPYITAVSAYALTDTIYKDFRSETASVILFDLNETKDVLTQQILTGALGNLKDSSAIDFLTKGLTSENYDLARISAASLEEITGKKYEITAKPETDYDWSYLENIRSKRFITIQTAKGKIKAELYPEAAPLTVMNFLKLAEKNFYHNSIFHRVVPNFVIQDGDPTGTGYGGPGHSIRSEFSMLSYETGTLGMASSGKDTEGSQYFITHSPQPHLDGRYTIFGKVIEGQDIADQIIQGDEILRVVIE